MERVINFLSKIPVILIGGAFLIASLYLHITGRHVPVDPAWAVVLICGLPLVYWAIWQVINGKGMGKISAALLISIAMIASISIGELFAAGEVAFIMAIGGILEEKTVARAKRGIKNLISLTPVQGRRIVGGKEEIIPAGQIKQDDILRVLPGEAIPVDGQILSGNTSTDQSIMTGESLPVDKSVGDDVFCGTINRFGSVEIRATKVGEDSSLQKLIRMVKDAENNKAPMQRIVDKWASWLVPAALLIAMITYMITRDVTRAVTVLVVFCPCSLALATPTSIMAAIGQATKHGVIIKSGDALEQMGKVNCIAFDKTGTLTHGKLSVSDVISLDSNFSNDDLLIIAASVESFSEHPLGKAISTHAKEQKLALKSASDFNMIPGKGVSAVIDDKIILCGNTSYLSENSVSLNESAASALETLRNQGKAAILVSSDGICSGIVALSDTIRSSAGDMVQELRKMGTDSVLLTGDHAQTADYFAVQAGIGRVYAGLLPAQKVEKIRDLQQDGLNVCMIGDGVNDAPALKTANVGVAMGGMGSDIAVEAADIALMGDDISKIPYLKRLANATIRLIKINISMSMCINFAAITLSVLGLLTPVTGALVHNAGSVLVVLNAALLYDRKYK